MNEAAIALNRFGLGGRPGDSAPADARGWLKDQLRRYQARPLALESAPSRDSVMEFLEPDQPMTETMAGDKFAVRAEQGRQSSLIYQQMAAASIENAVASDTPFAERLVRFWTNHFAVSADGPALRTLAGLLEFEAIRPHLTGRFEDMLLAVERHPAMLHYLNQDSSLGPNSPRGLRLQGRGRGAGINENLAREILELHTLGVAGGYAQADVIEFAKALTGWTNRGIGAGSLRGPMKNMRPVGQFEFFANAHEPGVRTVLGRRYAQAGEEQASAVLADLAVHEATAHHIAGKLARHFLGEQALTALVERLAAAFLESRGSLASVYDTLIEARESWQPEPARFRTPWEWLIASLRALDKQDTGRVAQRLLVRLGEPLWRPGSPAGFADTDAHWQGPQALMTRVEIAQRLVAGEADPADPRELAEALLPGSLSDMTTRMIAGAESRPQGLALLLVAPEFLRR